MFGFLVAAPAIWFAALGLFDDPAARGLLRRGRRARVLVLAGGIMLGGRVFDRRGPEIVGAALRA